MHSSLNSLKFILISSLLLCFSGCSAGSGEAVPELADVNGVVTMDGAPLVSAKVIFEPQETTGNARRRASSATTQEDGSYSLEYNEDASGASLGKHRVMIIKLTDNPEDAGKQLVPTKYNDKSELTADVKADGNIINFDLKSK
ncbi:carboxypeptidase regulatory-like domain-containing protein [Gimesia sp.]|uniref:carboxypeptidase regulatory-like domain-containing protein n=1 Tax=Gimesia sp. TaxID=2024833 RepID=UPI0032EEC6CB